LLVSWSAHDHQQRQQQPAGKARRIVVMACAHSPPPNRLEVAAPAQFGVFVAWSRTDVVAPVPAARALRVCACAGNDGLGAGIGCLRTSVVFGADEDKTEVVIERSQRRRTCSAGADLDLGLQRRTDPPSERRSSSTLLTPHALRGSAPAPEQFCFAGLFGSAFQVVSITLSTSESCRPCPAQPDFLGSEGRIGAISRTTVCRMCHSAALRRTPGAANRRAVVYSRSLRMSR
jgi:hypothetical protein